MIKGVYIIVIELCPYFYNPDHTVYVLKKLHSIKVVLKDDSIYRI